MRNSIRNLLIGGLLATTALGGGYYWNVAGGRAKTTTEVPPDFFIAGKVVHDALGSVDSRLAPPGILWVYSITLEDESGVWWTYEMYIPTPDGGSPPRHYSNFERSIRPGDVVVVRGDSDMKKPSLQDTHRMVIYSRAESLYLGIDASLGVSLDERGPEDVMRLEGRVAEDFLARKEREKQRR